MEAPDIAANRKARKWTPAELFRRALWEVSRGPLFAWTPRPMWAWRRVILRTFGAHIGDDVHIHPSVRIEIPWNLWIEEQVAIGDRAILYSLGTIMIGRAATISQNAHLCAGSHDFRSLAMELLKPPISIEPGAWVCADAFVGPGVKVGRLAVVGARAVVVRDVPSGVVVAGNPAKVIGKR